MAGDTIGQVIRGAARREIARRVFATVHGVGAGRCDVVLDGGTTLLQRVKSSVTVRSGQRVELRQVDGDYTVVAVLEGR